jgi:hypothetical protein
MPDKENHHGRQIAGHIRPRIKMTMKTGPNCTFLVALFLFSVSTALAGGAAIRKVGPFIIARSQQKMVKAFSEVPSHKSLNIIIRTADAPISKEEMGYHIARVEEKMDGLVLFADIQTLDELDQTLNLASDEYIQSLHIFAHMGQIDGIPSLAIDRLRKETYRSFNGTPWNSTLKFLPDAFVFMWGCKLVPRNQERAAESFEAIAKSLNMESGWIYANYVSSPDLVGSLTVPFWREPNRNPGRLSFQLMYPFTFPLFLFLDKVVLNWGHLYGFDGGGFYSIEGAHKHSVRDGVLSSDKVRVEKQGFQGAL